MRALRFFDFLFGVLIVFPLVLGGAWISKPGLKVELVELAVPVLILAFIGALIHWIARPEWTKSYAFIAFTRLWSRWVAFNTRKPVASLWCGAAIAGVIYAFAALRRHWAFGSGAADLGIFTNAIWNLVNGNGYVSSVKDGLPLFADHQSPIFWLFAPAFALLPQAETLLILQSFALATTGVFAARLATQALGDRDPITSAIPLMVWINPAIRAANSFDFHPEVTMLPLFLAAILGIQSASKRAQLGGWIAFLFALAGKESAGPVAAAIGIVWLLTPKFHKQGIFALVLGLSWFLFCLKVVPGLFGKTYAYEDAYAHFGGGLLGVITAPFRDPVFFLSHIFNGPRIWFLFWTLVPLAFLPLLSPLKMIAALPGYLMLFLSVRDHRVNTIYHYGIEPAVGLLWALPEGWARLRSGLKSKPQRWRSLAPIVILFLVLLEFGRSEISRIRRYDGTQWTYWLRSELIPAVTAQKVSVSGAMVPHLADRLWVNHLPDITLADGSPVDCVIEDPTVNNWPMSTEEVGRLPETLKNAGFSLVYECQTLKVYERPVPQGQCLREPPKCPDLRAMQK